MSTRRWCVVHGPGLAALAMLAASCDALIGLGDEPAASEPGTSGGLATSSSGEGAGTSSSGASVVTSTAAAGGGGSSADVTTSTGQGGGGGDGGGGGAAPPPCGVCDETCDECAGPLCRKRVHEPIPISGVKTGDSVLNRLGRGLAVTDEVIAFWAGKVGTDAIAVHVLDRADGQLDGDPLVVSAGFPTIAAVPSSGRIFLADNAGDLKELARGEKGSWALLDLPDAGIPVIGASAGYPGGLLLAHRNNGQSLLLDPEPGAPEPNPCPVSTVGLGATPIDARVQTFDGALSALVVALQPVDATLPFSVVPLTPCPNAEAYTVGQIEGATVGMAIAARGQRLYVKYAPTKAQTAPVVALVDREGKPAGASIATNYSPGLEALPLGVLVPDPVGGLRRCGLDLEGACPVVLTTAEIGDVHIVRGRGSGFVAVGYKGEEDGPGDARVACMDLAL